MSSKENSLLKQVLNELKELRQDNVYIQRTLVRMEATNMPNNGPQRSSQASSNRPASSNRQMRNNNASPLTVTPTRRLLTDISNQPAGPKICWYHRQFGLATDLSFCPGYLHCHFNTEAVKKMALQARAVTNKPSTSVQGRLENVQNQSSPAPPQPLPPPNRLPPPKPLLNAGTVPVAVPVAVPVHPIQEIRSFPISMELEKDLLDSDDDDE